MNTLRVIDGRGWNRGELVALAQLWEAYKKYPPLIERVDYTTDVGDPLVSFLRRDGSAGLTIAKIGGDYLVTVDDGGHGETLYHGPSMEGVMNALWVTPAGHGESMKKGGLTAVVLALAGGMIA